MPASHEYMSINYHKKILGCALCVHCRSYNSYEQLCQSGLPTAVPFVVEIVTVTARVSSSAMAQITKANFLPSVRSSLTVYDVLSNITRA